MPKQKSQPRQASTYRQARRNLARRNKLIWRQLERTVGAGKDMKRVAGDAFEQPSRYQWKMAASGLAKIALINVQHIIFSEKLGVHRVIVPVADAVL